MLVLTRNLKVALISSEYPPSSLGGVSAVCYDLSLNLSKRGVSTTVFCGKSENTTVENVNACLKVVRMPIVSFPPRHLWFPFQNHGSLSVWLNEFDVVHNVDTRAGGLLTYLSKSIDKPFVAHVHGCGHCETKVFLESPVFSWSLGEFVYTVLEYPLNECLVNLSLHHSDHIVVCSTARLTEMKRRNPEIDLGKVSVVYNGIDLQRKRYENIGSEEDFSVLFWGRLFYNKGIIQLLRAMALVKKDFPNVSFDICGKGPLDSKIRALRCKLDLENNVHIHGYVNDEFLIEKIRRASVVTLPSLYEGQPVAALEAMAHRKAVIMYDFPFAREYLTDWNNGLIAKGGSIEDLADRICVALSDKKLRKKLGQNAYERIKRNHNWDILVNEYISLYDNLAK